MYRTDITSERNVQDGHYKWEECTGRTLQVRGMYRTDITSYRNVQCTVTLIHFKGKFQLGNTRTDGRTDGHTDRRTHGHSDIWTSRAASSQLKIIIHLNPFPVSPESE